MSFVRRRKESQIIEALFSNRKITQLQEYLEQNPELDLLTLIDNQENTILHQLAFEGHLDIIKLFVKEIRLRLARQASKQKKLLFQKDHQQVLKSWMDRQNSEGFTALLYASYSGHLDVIQYLVQEHQANYELTTQSGLSPLHLAAQKNMVLPLIYFREKIDINSQDQLNSTALHWAAYTNSEQVVAFLLAEERLKCLNHQDHEGNTPLMLSVQYGNARIVRRLLIKGADRSIVNNQNKTPLQVAKQNKFKNIGKMLDQNLTCCDLFQLYCNIKIEYKPSNRKWTYPFIFLFSFFVNAAILNLLLEFRIWYVQYCQVVLFAIMLILYFTLLDGPTMKEPKDYAELIKEKSQKNVKKMCFQCKNFVPRRGYHCDICKVCVQQYDHHCTWINNCVGKKNIGRFIFFLFFLILSLGSVGLASVLGQICIVLDEPAKYEEWFVLHFLVDNLTKRILFGILFGICIFSSMFVVPVLLLFIHQIKNLLKNKTTFEFMHKPQSDSGEIKEKMRKYHSKMSLRNCKMMCSDSKSSVCSFHSNEEGEQTMV